MVELRVGEPAPDFELRDQHGRTVSLSELRGRSVVLVFYPYAFSSVCTGELADLRDTWPAFDREDVAVLGISCDPMFSLRAYADAEGLDFPLLSDFWPHGAVASAYGVLDDLRGCARRSTFVVDRDGVLRWLLHNPMGEARRTQDYLDILEDLRR